VAVVLNGCGCLFAASLPGLAVVVAVFLVLVVVVVDSTCSVAAGFLQEVAPYRAPRIEVYIFFKHRIAKNTQRWGARIMVIPAPKSSVCFTLFTNVCKYTVISHSLGDILRVFFFFFFFFVILAGVFVWRLSLVASLKSQSI